MRQNYRMRWCSYRDVKKNKGGRLIKKEEQKRENYGSLRYIDCLKTDNKKGTNMNHVSIHTMCYNRRFNYFRHRNISSILCCILSFINILCINDKI